MEPLSSYLTLLADQILIPAATLSELPDLNIEPAKVHQLILDYVFDQDCPGTLASLQRELTRATRRQHLNHSSSRIVQLISKGLVYEKNRPRLELILKGCDAIMKALEKLPSAPDQLPQPSTSKPHQALAPQTDHDLLSRAEQTPVVQIPIPPPAPWSAAPPSVEHQYSHSILPNHTSLPVPPTLKHPLPSHPTFSSQLPARPTPIIHPPSNSSHPIQRPPNEPPLNRLSPHPFPPDAPPHSLSAGNSLQLSNPPALNPPSPQPRLPGPSSERSPDRPASARLGSDLQGKPGHPPTDHHTSRPPSPRPHPRISISIDSPIITPKPLEKASWPSNTQSAPQNAHQPDLHRCEQPVQSTSNARFPNHTEDSLLRGLSEWRTIGDSDEIMYLASVGPSPRSIPVVIDDNDDQSPRRSRSPVLEMEQSIKLEEPNDSQAGSNQAESMGSKKRSHPIFRQNIDPQLAALEDQPGSDRKKARLAPLRSPHVSPSYSDNMVLETPTLPRWPRGLSVLQQEGEMMMPGTPPELMSPYLDGCPIAEDGMAKSENEFGGGESSGAGDGGAGKGLGDQPRMGSEAGSPARTGGCERGQPEGERRRQTSHAESPPSRHPAFRVEGIEASEPAVHNDNLAVVSRGADVAEVRAALDARQQAAKVPGDQAAGTTEGEQAPRLEPQTGPVGSPDRPRVETRGESGRAGEDGAKVGHDFDSGQVGSASRSRTGTGEMIGLDPAEHAQEVFIEPNHTSDLNPERIRSASGTGNGPQPQEPARAIDLSIEATQLPDLRPEALGSGPGADAEEPSGQLQSTQPASTAALSTLEELRAKLIASRKGRLKTGSPAHGAASPSGRTADAVQVLEQSLRAQLKIRRAGSPGSQNSVGAGGLQTDDMEDGQITTPPPDERRTKPLDGVVLPTVHPLPSKPDFAPAVGAGRTYKPGAPRAGGRGGPPMAKLAGPIPGLSVANPAFSQLVPGPFGPLGIAGHGPTAGAWAGPGEPVATAGAWAGASTSQMTAGGGEAWRKPESEDAGAAGQARLTPSLADHHPQPGPSSHPLTSRSSSSSNTVNPATIRLGCSSSSGHQQAERKSKEHSPSDSLQLAALREREAVLAAELVRKRMDLKIALGGPVGGAGVGAAKAKGKGVSCSSGSSSSSASVSGGGVEQENTGNKKVSRVAFDWAKRLERPNAIETCTPVKIGIVSAKANEAESVEDFLTDLQKQIGGREAGEEEGRSRSGEGGADEVVVVAEEEGGKVEKVVVKNVGRGRGLEVEGTVVMVVKQSEGVVDGSESEEQQQHHHQQQEEDKKRKEEGGGVVEESREGIVRQKEEINDNVEAKGKQKKQGGGGGGVEVEMERDGVDDERNSKQRQGAEEDAQGSRRPNGTHGLGPEEGSAVAGLPAGDASAGPTPAGASDRAQAMQNTSSPAVSAESESSSSMSGSESSLEIFVGDKKVLVGGGARFV